MDLKRAAPKEREKCMAEKIRVISLGSWNPVKRERERERLKERETGSYRNPNFGWISQWITLCYGIMFVLYTDTLNLYINKRT